MIELEHGTYEDALGWVGQPTDPVDCEHPVNTPQSRLFCALVEDANPVYWDEDLARALHGGPVAPPGTLMSWSLPLPWRPGPARGRDPLWARLPLPGTTLINVETDTSFAGPLFTGRSLRYVEEVVDVTPAKSTRVGTGHFATIRTTYWDGPVEGPPVAVHDNTMFRYDAQPASDPGPDDRVPARTVDGPQVSMPITLTRCVLDAAATLDFFPGHHDREYARAQGIGDVYVNTMFLHGLVDRVSSEAMVEPAWLERRVLRMSRPVCAGDTVVAVAGRGGGSATDPTFEVSVSTGTGPCASATLWWRDAVGSSGR